MPATQTPPTPKKAARRAAASKPPLNDSSAIVQPPPTAPQLLPEGTRQSIHPSLIDPHPHNRVIERGSCQGLADSMKTGQIQPATVRPHPTKPGRFELGAGARRWHAAALNDQPLDCLVRDLTDAQIETMLVVENNQREAPDPREEAAQLRRVFDAHPGADSTFVASILGRPDAWVKRRMRLLDLSDKLLEAWQNPKHKLHSLPVASMELLAALSKEEQKAFLQHCSDRPWVTFQHPAIVNWIRQISCSLKDVKWLNDPATFVDGCGPGCATSSEAGDLFSQTEFAGEKSLQCAQCLNATCFKKRRELARLASWSAAIDKAPEGFFAIIGYEKETLKLTDGRQIKTQSQSDFYSWKDCKKSEPEARPFLIENRESGTVRLSWKKAPEGRKAEDLPKPADAEPAVKTPEQSEKASIERVQVKRWCHILDQIKTVLEKAPNPFPDTPDKLIALAACFGTDDRDPNATPKTWKDFDKLLAGEGKESATGRLWDQVHGILKRRLTDQRYTRRLCDVLEKDFQAELKRIAGLIGFDLTIAYACAALACPPAKSLAHLDPLTLKRRG